VLTLVNTSLRLTEAAGRSARSYARWRSSLFLCALAQRLHCRRHCRAPSTSPVDVAHDHQIGRLRLPWHRLQGPMWSESRPPSQAAGLVSPAQARQSLRARTRAA